jgi:hypothetical protein
MKNQPNENKPAAPAAANENAAIKFIIENFGVSKKDWHELFQQYGVSASKIVEVIRQYATK